MYFQPSTNNIYSTHSEIRSALSNVLFPPVIDDEMLAYVGIFPLSYVRPEIADDESADPLTVELIDGVWTQLWSVRPATQEEIDARGPAIKPVPQQCAMWQARAILIEDDLLGDVNSALASIPDEKARKLAQAKFEYSSTVRRDDPLVTEVIPKLGKSESEIDAMFVRAVAL